VGSQNFVTHFLDEALSQNVAHIDVIYLLGDAQVALDIIGLLFMEDYALFSFLGSWVLVLQ
jgi:hypothetical protein